MYERLTSGDNQPKKKKKRNYIYTHIDTIHIYRDHADPETTVSKVI